jgi:hypothetical protein
LLVLEYPLVARRLKQDTFETPITYHLVVEMEADIEGEMEDARMIHVE